MSDMLTESLANIATDLRMGRDALTEHRRAICLGTDGVHARCLEVKITTEGNMKCNLCGCEDPARDRPRCPAFKW